MLGKQKKPYSIHFHKECHKFEQLQTTFIVSCVFSYQSELLTKKNINPIPVSRHLLTHTDLVSQPQSLVLAVKMAAFVKYVNIWSIKIGMYTYNQLLHSMIILLTLCNFKKRCQNYISMLRLTINKKIQQQMFTSTGNQQSLMFLL